MTLYNEDLPGVFWEHGNKGTKPKRPWSNLCAEQENKGKISKGTGKH
jgi:hypothetical protein